MRNPSATTCYLAAALHLLLACHPLRCAIERWAPHFCRAPVYSVAAHIADAMEHIWGARGATPFDPEPLRAAVAAKSPNRELQVIEQHDTEIAFRTMLDELLRALDDLGEV